MTNLKEEFEKLRKQHNLPEFDKLNKEFELCSIELENCGLLIRAILRLMTSKLNLFLSYLEPVISPPNQSLHSLVETHNIEDETKRKIFSFYKRIAFLIHESLQMELKSDEEVAEQIKKIFKEWPKIKEEQLKFLEIIKQSWLKEDTEEESNNYTG